MLFEQNPAKPRVRLTGLWRKTDANGNAFFTGNMLDPSLSTSEAAKKAIAALSEPEAAAIVSVIGKRVNIFKGPAGVDYRLLLADPVPMGSDIKTPLVAVANLKATPKLQALRGNILSELDDDYNALSALKGTIVITSVTKRSENDADCAMYYEPVGGATQEPRQAVAF